MNLPLALIAHHLSVPAGAIQVGLREYRIDSLVADSHEALLEARSRLDPQLLIIERKLPPFGALEAIRAIRAFEQNAVPIIVLLGDDDSAEALRLQRAGATDFITGKYSWQKLAEVLARIELPVR